VRDIITDILKPIVSKVKEEAEFGKVSSGRIGAHDQEFKDMKKHLENLEKLYVSMNDLKD